MVQEAAALYLLDTRHTSSNCLSDRSSSSAPGFISHPPLHDIGFTAVAAPDACRAGGQPDDLPKPSTQRGAVVGVIAGRRHLHHRLTVFPACLHLKRIATYRNRLSASTVCHTLQ